MTSRRIRTIAIGVLIEQDRLLAMRVLDQTGAMCGVRPLGGGIEFGETSAATLMREFREEIGAEIVVGGATVAFESLFTYSGRDYHEIVIARPARFRDAEAPRQEEYEIVEDGGLVFTASWFSLAALRAADPPLFPIGLAAKLGAFL